MLTASLLPALLCVVTLGSGDTPGTRAEGAFEIEMAGADLVASARARDAAVADVAKRLEHLLRVPVQVSNALAGTRVSFRRLTDVSLDELLLRIAPVVFVDARESREAGTKLLAIHLGEAGSSAPAVETSAIGAAGSTADAGDAAVAADGDAAPPDDGPFLRVRREQGGRISVAARDQGLGVLLFEVAQAYGARFDLRVPEAPIVGRFDVSGILPSELPGYLGFPGVGIEVRRNVATGEEVLLRCSVDSDEARVEDESPNGRNR